MFGNINFLFIYYYIHTSHTLTGNRLTTYHIRILKFTSDPPRLRTGAMLILKCFSTISYSLPREMSYLTLK
jgi:hypothetical protein